MEREYDQTAPPPGSAQVSHLLITPHSPVPYSLLSTPTLSQGSLKGLPPYFLSMTFAGQGHVWEAYGKHSGLGLIKIPLLISAPVSAGGQRGIFLDQAPTPTTLRISSAEGRGTEMMREVGGMDQPSE